MLTIGGHTINFTELYNNINHISDLDHVAEYLSNKSFKEIVFT